LSLSLPILWGTNYLPGTCTHAAARHHLARLHFTEAAEHLRTPCACLWLLGGGGERKKGERRRRFKADMAIYVPTSAPQCYHYSARHSFPPDHWACLWVLCTLSPTYLATSSRATCHLPGVDTYALGAKAHAFETKGNIYILLWRLSVTFWLKQRLFRLTARPRVTGFIPCASSTWPIVWLKHAGHLATSYCSDFNQDIVPLYIILFCNTLSNRRKEWLPTHLPRPIPGSTCLPMPLPAKNL